jgi:heavy metal sensor kinase
MKFNTLRTRFALWTALLILLVLAVFGTYVYLSMARGLYAALDNTLQVSASQIIASLNVNNGKLILPDSLSEPPEGEAPPAGFSVRILTPDGAVLQQTGVYTFQLPPVTTPLPAPFYTTLTSPPLRIFTVPVTDNNQLVAIVQVSQSTSTVQATLGRLLTTLLIAAPLLLLAAAASGYFLAARALRPIDAMTSMARRISAEDLSARLNLSSDDELGRLASTFDEMLARLEDSFHRERQFTADASHELRTPLAAMQAILSVTRQRRRKPAEYEKALDDLSEETDRLRNLAESLLSLARADLHPILLSETIDLSTLLDDVTESLRPLAEAKGLNLACETASSLAVQGESDGLIRLFINLLDNAIKYTEHGSVSVSACREGAQVHIEISDTGIGIPASHLPHVFERFYRVEQARSKRGTGLGLSLVQQIVLAHGGTISVASRFGKGSTFTVEIPFFPQS